MMSSIKRKNFYLSAKEKSAFSISARFRLLMPLAKTPALQYESK